MPTGSMPELIELTPAAVMRRSVSNNTGWESLDMSFGVAQQCSPPSQYSGFFVLGVPPPFVVTTSPMPFASHPSGTGPMSESTKRVNIFLKTAAYVGDIGRPGLREALHPPIDGGLWEGVEARFTRRPDILDAALHVRRIKDIATYPIYRTIIEGCRAAAKELKCDLIEVEQLWRGAATPGDHDLN